MTEVVRLTFDEAAARLGAEEARKAFVWSHYWRRGDLSYLLHDGRAPDDPLVRRYVFREDIEDADERAKRASVPFHERRGQLGAAALVQRCEETGQVPVFKIGRQWGKSRFFVVDANAFCLRRCLARQAGAQLEPARIPYAAPTAKQVEDFIFPHLLFMQEEAPPELRPEFHKGDWVFPDESRIVIRGCEDKRKADRLRGPKAHRCYVDEAGFIDILGYVLDSVLGWQLATTGGLMLVSSSPPESPDHPFVPIWEAAVARGTAFESTTPEAPHMTEKLIERQIERAGGEDTVAWRREGRAEIIPDPEDVAIPEWSEAAPVIVAEHPRPAYYRPVIIGDLGYEDLTVIAFGYYDFRADLDVIEDEVVLQHARSDIVDAETRTKARDLWGEKPIAQRHVDAQPITRADMSVDGMGDESDESDDAKGEWWQGVRKDEKTAALNELRIRVQRKRLRVHPRCTTILAHCQFGRWNARRTEWARPEKAKHHYDGLDAAIYFVRMLDRQTNPYPRLPEHVTHDDHFINPKVVQETRREQELFVPKSKRGKRWPAR